MNIRFTREFAVIAVIVGAIVIANPNLWWLLFFVFGGFWFNTDQSDERSSTRRMPRGRYQEIRRTDGTERRSTTTRELRRQRLGQSQEMMPGVFPPRPLENDSPAPAPRRAPSTSGPMPHAAEAVRAAGHPLDGLALLPVDIGLMAYSGSQRPVLHREAPVPDTVDFVQPFVELQLSRPAAGTLRFEILDSTGEVVYRREERRQLPAGRTPVIPATRMPVGDFLFTEGGWTLNVYAADTLLASHTFGWGEPADATGVLREHLAQDGELSADLAMLVEEAHLQPLSLDDLLDAQDEPRHFARSS